MADPTSADRSRLQPVPLVPLADRDRQGGALPVSLTSLVGREHEVAEVSVLLHAVRLLTLTGPGGVGKTRLALRVAEGVASDVPDGVAFVGLAALADPALVLPTIAHALGVREGGDRPLLDRLGALLGDRRLLLVLDTLEHLADAAPQLANLLTACPRLTILATSRVVLRLSGEQVYSVAPLAIPDAVRSLELADLAKYGAVALFAQRARAADPAFALNAANASAVAEIVRRLDGLPLAIELAAAKVRSLPPPALLAHLDSRMRLLTGGPRDQPARLRTMRDAISWSYGLLDPPTRRVFRQLGVFAGGFTLAAAATVVAAPTGASDPLDAITDLVDASLIRRADGLGESRYAMLETIRAFALEQLEASGERDETYRTLARWYVDLTEPTLVGFSPGDVSDTLARMTVEIDNLRAALGWVIERGETGLALRLSVALCRFWSSFGHYAECRQWLTQALALPADAADVSRGRALCGLSSICSRLGDLDEGRSLAEEGLAIARATGDLITEGWANTTLGFIAVESGALDQSQVRAERALEIARALGDRWWEHAIMKDLGTIASLRGDYAQAISLYETVLPFAHARGDRALVAFVSADVAYALVRRGELRRGTVLLREVLESIRALGDPDHLAITIGDVADLAARFDRAASATRLLGARARLFNDTGVSQLRINQADDERLDAFLRASLDEATFVASWAAGAALPLDTAVAEADALLAELIALPEPPAPAPAPLSGGITARELDVLRLVAEGHSDRAIAETLFVGPSTIRTHLSSLFGKLDVGSRTAAVAAGHRLGILLALSHFSRRPSDLHASATSTIPPMRPAAGGCRLNPCRFPPRNRTRW